MHNSYMGIGFFIMAFMIISANAIAGTDMYEGPISDFIVTAIGCDMTPTDACVSNDVLGLPADFDCWTNDSHKLVLNIEMPDDFVCRIALEGFFNGSKENDESVEISVNGYVRAWDDDGRGEGISELTIPGTFLFVKGKNTITLTHPNFNAECRDDPAHLDKDYPSGEINFGKIHIYDCIKADEPQIFMSLQPSETAEDDSEINCSITYSDNEAKLSRAIIRWHNGTGNILKENELCLEGGLFSYKSTLEPEKTNEGDTIVCKTIVYDTDGVSNEMSASVRIGTSPEVFNEDPIADILFPVEGAFFAVGRKITLRGTATDPEDGHLGPDSVLWSYVHGGRQKVMHSRTIETSDGEIQTNFTFHGTGTYILRMTATDSGGKSSTDSVIVNVYNPSSFIYLPSEYMKLTIGASDFIKETLISDFATENIFTLELDGYERAEYMTAGIDGLEYASPNRRSISIRMPPFSSKTIFIKVFGDSPGVSTLIQDAHSDAMGDLRNEITIDVGYPPNFPESDNAIILIAILCAAIIFALLSKN
ncbi:MAG: hypothetical protein GXO64_04080 [Candidatus Micrarchaeota archaeon]|nr:hypothetical protein [Candidatus Micrarchaeota archaeon]